MLKNRKTGNPVPINVVNILHRKTFEEIYQIKEITYISDTIEAFTTKQRIKPSYRSQELGNASEVCSPLNALNVQINI